MCAVLAVQEQAGSSGKSASLPCSPPSALCRARPVRSSAPRTTGVSVLRGGCQRTGIACMYAARGPGCAQGQAWMRVPQRQVRPEQRAPAAGGSAGWGRACTLTHARPCPSPPWRSSNPPDRFVCPEHVGVRRKSIGSGRRPTTSGRAASACCVLCVGKKKNKKRVTSWGAGS